MLERKKELPIEVSIHLTPKKRVRREKCNKIRAYCWGFHSFNSQKESSTTEESGLISKRTRFHSFNSQKESSTQTGKDGN